MPCSNFRELGLGSKDDRIRIPGIREGTRNANSRNSSRITHYIHIWWLRHFLRDIFSDAMGGGTWADRARAPGDDSLSLPAPRDSRAGRIRSFGPGFATVPALHPPPGGGCGAKMPPVPHPRVDFQSSFTKNFELLAGGPVVFRRGMVESRLYRSTWLLGVRQWPNGYR
jgi:hypothetical protein